MKAATTTVREAIAAALQAAGLPAYPAPLGTTPVPSIVIEPDQPYMTPTALGRNTWRVQLRLAINVPALDTATALLAIEVMAQQILDALPPGCDVTELTQPGLQSLGQAQGSIYAAELVMAATGNKEN